MTGLVPALNLFRGMHVPAPLEVADHIEQDSGLEHLLREVLILTKPNWNSSRSADRYRSRSDSRSSSDTSYVRRPRTSVRCPSSSSTCSCVISVFDSGDGPPAEAAQLSGLRPDERR